MKVYHDLFVVKIRVKVDTNAKHLYEQTNESLSKSVPYL